MLKINKSQLDDLRAAFDEGMGDFAPFIDAMDTFARTYDAKHGWDVADLWAVLDGALRAVSNWSVIEASGELSSCAVTLVGKTYWRNAEGALIPIEAVRPADQLQDETVRKIIGFAKPLSAEISRFWQHTRKDIADFVDLVLQHYAASRGGKKGNITLTSFDDMLKVELRVSRLIEFGADLQAAKVLTDECLAEWSEDSNAHIRTIVRTAFNVDRDGRVNQQALLGLLRHEIADERWQRAMEAIRNAIRVRATKEYLRFWERPAPGADWKAITIDLAQA